MGKPLIYTPFNSELGEKLEIQSFTILESKEDDNFTLLYKLKKEMDNGDIATFYKASQFFRLTRVARITKGESQLMEVQSDIIRGVYKADINYVQLIANILSTEEESDIPGGLLYLYGVQAVGATKEEALKKARYDYGSLLRSFQGTHRTAHLTTPTYDEIEWIFRKLREQTHVTVVKGIPASRNTSGATKNKLTTVETSTEEQMEQFLSGMITEEFLLMLMATPIQQKVLRTWLTKSLKEQTKWEGQKQGSNSLSFGIAVPMGISMNTGESSGMSMSRGESAGQSFGQSWGESQSFGTSESFGTNVSESMSRGVSESVSESQSQSQSENFGTNESTSRGSSENLGVNAGMSGGLGNLANVSAGASKGWGTNESSSMGQSHGVGSSQSESASESFGKTAGSSQSIGSSQSFGKTQSQSQNVGGSESRNVGQSSNIGKNVGMSRGWGSSMGIAPNLSIGKNYQFQDVTVAYITELLTIQNQRLKDSTEGEGAFFVDMYISTKNERAQRSITTLVSSTWVNNDAKIDVLRAWVPDPVEQKTLSMHMQALSPNLSMERNRVGKFYKYSSILRSSEISAYSHPPRISTGGLDNAMHDRPILRVPNNRQREEVFIGNVINGERFNMDQAKKYGGNGYMTDYKFGVGTDELHHAFISGQAGSGKSVLAWRMVSGLYNNTFNIDRKTGKRKRKRILILDPKGEWRLMGNIIPRGKFKFKSLSDPHFHPVSMNILRVPRYVRAYDYYQMVIENFCSAYGLMDRALAQIGSVIYDLYDEKDAFDNDLDPNWANERTKDVTMEDVYDQVEKNREIAIQKRDNHNAEALQTYLTRLDAFKKPKSKEYIMFCNRGGDSVDQFLGEDEVTVVESNGLSKQAQGFFFTLTMASIFKFAQGVKGFYNAPDQYETFIVLEEANAVLIGGEKDDASTQGIKRFEELLDQSRSFGLFIWVITQKIASMPDSVVANSGLIFAGKSTRDQDIGIVMRAIGLEDRYENDGRAMKKFFPKMPVGEFVVKISKAKLEADQESTLVKVAPLDLEIPSDEELDVIINENKIAQIKQKRLLEE
jgi:hypothetical protein